MDVSNFGISWTAGVYFQLRTASFREGSKPELRRLDWGIPLQSPHLSSVEKKPIVAPLPTSNKVPKYQNFQCGATFLILHKTAPQVNCISICFYGNRADFGVTPSARTGRPFFFKSTSSWYQANEAKNCSFLTPPMWAWSFCWWKTRGTTKTPVERGKAPMKKTLESRLLVAEPIRGIGFQVSNANISLYYPSIWGL